MANEVKGAVGVWDNVYSSPIDVSTWVLDATKGMSELLKQSLREACKAATECEGFECFALFSPEDDQEPGTIDVLLPLGSDEEKEPCWKFTLSDIVSQLIEYRLKDEDQRGEALAIMRVLREQAGRIEAAVAAGTAKQ